MLPRLSKSSRPFQRVPQPAISWTSRGSKSSLESAPVHQLRPRNLARLSYRMLASSFLASLSCHSRGARTAVRVLAEHGFHPKENFHRPPCYTNRYQPATHSKLLYRYSGGNSNCQRRLLTNDIAQTPILCAAQPCSAELQDTATSELPAKPSPMTSDGVILSSERDMISSSDAAELKRDIVQARASRDKAFELGRLVSSACSNYISSLHYGNDGGQARRSQEDYKEAKKLLMQHFAENPLKPGCREEGLNGAVEQLLIAEGFQHFLDTGKTMSRVQLGSDTFDDEEYMSGVMGVCQELAHYALRRATELDYRSVELCDNFIKQVKAELVQFDFRNSVLRRRFDGIKYAERRCVDILYELSFSFPIPPLSERGGNPSILDAQEWARLRETYEVEDQKREQVIKGCRDVQKAAKQAIQATHRSDLERAEILIESAKLRISELFESYVKNSPRLRFGSFNSALEELAEAQLFLHWSKQVHTQAAAVVLPERSELSQGLLDTFSYVGALSDFTGEVGRVSVTAATRRDKIMVRQSLLAISAAYSLLASLPLEGKGNRKNVDAAKRNLRKLEMIEYDLAVRANNRGPSVGDLDSMADEGDNESEQA